MLHAQKINKSFGPTHAVVQLDLDVEVGQIRGLLGPNGAGKSTAIRMICGVLAPDSGTIELNGVDLSVQPSKAKELLGYVPDGAPLPFELLPIEFLRYTASMYGMRSRASKELIEDWAVKCDITTVLKKPIGSLSRGFRQRVALAGALLHSPKLLVLDEPSTGLDPAQNASFRELLRELSKTSAIIYSSHNLAEVEATCDVVSIIHNGKLLLDGAFSAMESEDSSIIVEVSPKTIAEQIGGTEIDHIDSDWARCTVGALAGEVIVDQVARFGGKIRLLQPVTSSLESNYLRIIHESETVS